MLADPSVEPRQQQRIHRRLSCFAVGESSDTSEIKLLSDTKVHQSLYLSISDANLLSAIDRMKFDKGDTEIFVKISSSNA